MAGFDTYRSLFTLGMGAVMLGMLAFCFNISVTVEAGFKQSMDPAYPYLQAVAMHKVNGRPFLFYLSKAMETKSQVVEGVNVTEELSKFDESFRLVDAKGARALSIDNPRNEGSNTVKNAFLAVPPGGYLVMNYEWS